MNVEQARKWEEKYLHKKRKHRARDAYNESELFLA